MTQIEQGSTNVYADLGIGDAEEMLGTCRWYLPDQRILAELENLETIVVCPRLFADCSIVRGKQLLVAYSHMAHNMRTCMEC